jgi:hypothetical protein
MSPNHPCDSLFQVQSTSKLKNIRSRLLGFLTLWIGGGLVKVYILPILHLRQSAADLLDTIRDTRRGLNSSEEILTYHSSALFCFFSSFQPTAA